MYPLQVVMHQMQFFVWWRMQRASIYKLTIYWELYWEVLKFHFSVTAKIPPVQGASPLIYRGLHLALESVAVKSLNIYGTKIWR